MSDIFNFSDEPVENEANSFYLVEANNLKIKKENKKAKRKEILQLIWICVSFTLTVVLIAFTFMNIKDKQLSSIGDGTILALKNSIKTNNKYDPAVLTELTPAQIANKCTKSSVGIVNLTNKGISQGSGIVMSLDKSGKYTYVITCAHVINKDNIQLSVVDYEGNYYNSVIVGTDDRSDIAVLKVATNKLTCAEFGNSDNLVVGDEVYAIGNPGGKELSCSFTRGVVSFKNRLVTNEDNYNTTCIQHDAAISPGNSGGMLVNKYGQVIGINSQKIANTEYEGLGFAIPISTSKRIIDDLIEYGQVNSRAWIGISYGPVAENIHNFLMVQKGLIPEGSMLIKNVTNEDLLNAGVEKGDIVIKIDNKELKKTSVLLDVLNNKYPGDKITMTVIKVKNLEITKTFDVNVTLVKEPK